MTDARCPMADSQFWASGSLSVIVPRESVIRRRTIKSTHHHQTTRPPEGVMDHLFGPHLTRRELFCKIGGGFGALGLAGAFAEAGLLAGRADAAEAVVPANPLAPRPSHFPARAKRVIFLFMNRGPPHLDTLHPKPLLK